MIRSLKVGLTVFSAGLFSLGFALGRNSAGVIPWTKHWLYYSDVKGEFSAGIHSDGTLVFGSRCDGAVEARKFYSMLQQLRDNPPPPPICRNAQFQKPECIEGHLCLWHYWGL